MERFSHIDTWVFDLDNTLYDAESHIFVEMGKRMSSFVAEQLKLPMDEAQKLRRAYYEKYGTTLRGLMTEHGIHPDAFLEYTHDLDLAPVVPCAVTQSDLARLPGRRFIFTNASRSFADRMTAHLGIRHHFDAIFAIEDADYWPKPHVDTYHGFFRAHGVNPRTACMFEDMEINLRPAHELGMTTVWLHRGNEPVAHPHVHHNTPTLTDWLSATIKR